MNFNEDALLALTENGLDLARSEVYMLKRKVPLMTICQGLSGRGMDIVRELMEPHRAAFLKAGDVCVVKGLVAKPELNGILVELIEQDYLTGRWIVKRIVDEGEGSTGSNIAASNSVSQLKYLFLKMQF
jgi:hypothetical protein